MITSEIERQFELNIEDTGAIGFEQLPFVFGFRKSVRVSGHVHDLKAGGGVTLTHNHTTFTISANLRLTSTLNKAEFKLGIKIRN